MLPLKTNTETAKNNNPWINLWNIIFHKRSCKGGPQKESGPQQITTHLGEVILPLSLIAHCCSEQDHSFVQSEWSVYSLLINITLASFLGQYYHSFRPTGIPSLSTSGYKHLRPIDSNISRSFTCKYCRILANTTFKVHLFSQSLQLLYSHRSYFKSCSYLLF